MKDLLRFLIESGAEATAFTEASRFGELEIVQELLNAGWTVDARDEGGCTALMLAASGGQAKIVQLLLDAGADVNARDSRKGMTPLMCLLGAGHSARVALKIVKMLLEAGADPNIRANDGSTALNWARERDHTSVLKLLAQSGAEAGDPIKCDLVIPERSLQATDSGYIVDCGFAQIELPQPERLKAKAIEWLVEAFNPPQDEAANLLRLCDLSYDIKNRGFEQLIEVVIAAPTDAYEVLQDQKSPITSNIMGALTEVCPDLGSDRLIRKA
jgi:ankyrin repeat protein